MIQAADLSVYHLLNGFAGNRLIDSLENHLLSSALLKGVFFLAIYWYLWFRNGPDPEKRRKAIIVVLIASVVSVVLCRLISFAAPFRVRPMFDLALPHRPYSLPVDTDLENWSSFPSDQVAWYFAVAFGIAYISRRLTIPIMLYTAAISLPRIHFGIDYASDAVVGAAAGIAVAWFALRTDWLRSRLASQVMEAADASPQLFYAAAFLASFEMSRMFSDLRDAARVVTHVARIGPRHEFVATALIAWAILGLAAAGAYWTLLRRPSAPQDRASGLRSSP